jgi:RNA polymerase sigma-70 factor (ECF subfamily)
MAGAFPTSLRRRPSKELEFMEPNLRGHLGQRVPDHFERADVGRAANGDHEAFERLYRGHVGRVYALAVRMVGSGEADDLTQEVFIRAWSKLGTFKGQSQFATWLHRLAVNHILSRRTVLRRRESRLFGGEGILGRLTAPKRRASGAALDLEHAIARLPSRAREVFVMYDVEGFSHEEVADALGVTVGTSKSQLHRARMLLREKLS